MNRAFLLFSISIFILASCSNELPEQPEVSIDSNYFPVEKGFFKEFKVKSINIDKASDVFDTANYFVRELNTGLIADASGDSVMRIERWSKDSVHHAWKPYEVWTKFVKDIDAIQMEENIKYIKLKFPLVLDKIWNGNALNRMDTLQSYSYQVISIDVPELVNEMTFDSMVTIQQRAEESLVGKIDDYEKYAYGVGLVYKQLVDIKSQDLIDPSIPIEDRVEIGSSTFIEIINYGYEN